MRAVLSLEGRNGGQRRPLSGSSEGLCSPEFGLHSALPRFQGLPPVAVSGLQQQTNSAKPLPEPPSKQELCMIPRITAALEFQGQALVLRAEKQRVIAGNIANADTPGFKSRDFEFAAALRNATAGLNAGHGSSDSSGGLPSAALGTGIARDILTPGGRAQPALQYSQPHQTHMDNNTVDMDRERGAFVENAVKFEAVLRFINGSVRTLQDAMKSANQG
jgi:flagellar basal-body rod protein FlgB